MRPLCWQPDSHLALGLLIDEFENVVLPGAGGFTFLQRYSISSNVAVDDGRSAVV